MPQLAISRSRLIQAGGCLKSGEHEERGIQIFRDILNLEAFSRRPPVMGCTYSFRYMVFLLPALL